MDGADQKQGHRAPVGGRSWRLARKELREILRDRRTVITLILMPLLVYPLLGTILSKSILSSLTSTPRVRVHVYVPTEPDRRLLIAMLYRGDLILQSEANVDGPLRFPEPAPAAPLTFETEPDLEMAVYTASERPGISLDAIVASGEADLAVTISEHNPPLLTEPPLSEPFRIWQLIRRKDSVLSERAFEAVQRRLEAVNRDYIRLLVEAKRIPPVRVADVREREVESQASDSSPLVTFIPLVLVLMTMTGAVYPAIDLTAGERERGTMEILIAAPVSRMNLLAGKFVAVLVVALLTAVMNLISMFVTLFALGLEGRLLGSIDTTMVVQVLVLMVVFAAFFSSVLLSITSIARSFKEAQAYLVPLMLVALTPGIFALLPDVQMNGLLAVTPLVNVVLMARDLLTGDVNILPFAIVLISTALYGVLALSLAARIFGSNAVLYGSAGTWSELLRRPATPTERPSVSLAAFCLAVLFALFIVLGPLGARLDVSLTIQLIINACVLFALFVGVPLLAAVSARVRLTSGFSLRQADVRAWVAAALLGVTVWPFLYEIQIFMMTEERIEFLRELMEKIDVDFNRVPFVVRLLTLAVVPAVCEELFFRGFLQNAFRSRTSAVVSVVSTAVLFGLFHVIVKDALMFERLLPSTLMGILLGLLYERSRSVFPGMLLHVLHNGILITVAHFEDALVASGIGVAAQQHLPASWLVIAGMGAVPGIWLLLTVKPAAESR